MGVLFMIAYPGDIASIKESETSRVHIMAPCERRLLLCMAVDTS